MFHFRKSASRGFEPTRDFGVLVTGFRQWWLPLRQRRGCGLRGAVRGELETDVGFLVGFGRDFGSYSNRVVDISVFAFSLVFLRIGVVFYRVLNAIEIA